MRPGEFMISTIFPKDKDQSNVLTISMVVFDTVRFGPQSLHSFVERFPGIPVAVFLSEVILDDLAEMYIKSLRGKNKNKQMSVSCHTFLLCSTVNCAICNTV